MEWQAAQSDEARRSTNDDSTSVEDSTPPPRPAAVVPRHKRQLQNDLEMSYLIPVGPFESGVKVTSTLQRSTSQQVVIKWARNDARSRASFTHEVNLLTLIHGAKVPHIIPLLGCITVHSLYGEHGFVMPRHRELDSELTSSFSEKDIMRLAMQMSAALEGLHALGILHFDVKPANIVMDESRNSFLIDFDLAQIDSPAFVSLAARGTHQFMAPEVRMRLFAGPAADIYSLGVTLRRVWNWQTPFQASDKLSSLIDRMTMADRSKRPYPSQVFKVRSRSLK